MLDQSVAGWAFSAAMSDSASAANRPQRGLFLVLEGIDGAGTTSQKERLLTWLQSLGLIAHGTAEPSSGPIGKLIRSLLSAQAEPLNAEAMALLFAGDRRDHLTRELRPQLEAGAVIVCDRYVLSSLAYQTAAAGVPREFVAQANAGVLQPDLTLYFDLPVQVAAQRRAQRAGTVEIYDADPLQQRVAAAYLREAHALQQAHEPVVFIDAAKDRDAVELELQKNLAPLLRAAHAQGRLQGGLRGL